MLVALTISHFRIISGFDRWTKRFLKTMAHIGCSLEVVRNKTETSNQNKAMAAGNRGAVPKRAAD
jgi:hypothetical protein